MNEEETIKRLKNKNLYINIKPKSSICIDCINENRNKHIETEIVINEELEEAIETVLNLLEKKDKEIHCLEEEKQDAWEEWNNLEQSSYEEEKKLRIELEKKDKMMNLMLEEISKNILNTCPLEDYNVDLDCENKCKDDYKECWKKYFEGKVENGN